MLGTLLLVGSLAISPLSGIDRPPVDSIYPEEVLNSVNDQLIDQIVSELDLPVEKSNHPTVVIAGEPLDDQEISLLNRFVAISGSELADVIHELDKHAQLASYSKNQVVFEIGAQLLEYRDRTEHNRNPQVGKTRHQLIPARHKGDIYFTDNGIYMPFVFVNWGHTGVYEDPTTVIESGDCTSNMDEDSTYRRSVTDRCWYGRYTRAFISGGVGHGRSPLIIKAAIDRSQEWERGIHPYNWNPFVNKDNRGTPKITNGRRRLHFNCSQLVWSAFLPYVDLDNNPRKIETTPTGIFPLEIIDHPQTNRY